jgi:hypothetical protein
MKEISKKSSFVVFYVVGGFLWMAFTGCAVIDPQAQESMWVEALKNGHGNLIMLLGVGFRSIFFSLGFAAVIGFIVALVSYYLVWSTLWCINWTNQVLKLNHTNSQ